MQIINRNMVMPQVGKGDVQSRPIPVNQQSDNFGSVFDNVVEKAQSVQFSKHANMRLNSRNIQLDAAQIARIESGVNAARDKGIRDSLVLVDDVALVVNIKNKLVVTALNQGNDHVFTNIDGAVIV